MSIFMEENCWRAFSRLLLIGIVIPAMPFTSEAYPRPGHNQRVAVNMQGGAPDAPAALPVITPDGRFVAYQSQASDIVTGDTNLSLDVFVFDRLTGATERVSLANDGSQGNNHSVDPSISGDGRFVAFRSFASNLVPLDTNMVPDIFVRDRQSGRIERVSVATDGTQANGNCIGAAISRDGRYVAFDSTATNLVPSDSNGVSDTFVHDRQTGTTERVSVGPGGVEGNGGSFKAAISADGRFVAFASSATNLTATATTAGTTHLYLRDRQAGTTELVDVPTDGSEANDSIVNPDLVRPGITPDGRYIIYFSNASNLVPSDTNGSVDVFLRDRATGTTERVSVPSDGTEPAFGADPTSPIGISDDGRYVTLCAPADLAPDDTNIYYDDDIIDRRTGQAELISVTDEGQSATANSLGAVVDASGRYPVMATFSLNFDNNQPPPGFDPRFYLSVFVRDRGPEVGVVQMSPSVVDCQVSLQGTAGYSGRVLTQASDPPDDGGVLAEAVGAELTGASLTYRPEPSDLFARIQLLSLSSQLLSPIPPPVLYGLNFTVDGIAYKILAAEIDASSGGTDPQFVLSRCQGDNSCSEVARLKGGIGTAGNEVRITIPLADINAGESSSITNVQVFTALGTIATGTEQSLDDMTLPSCAVPARQVTAGIAAPGTPESQVQFNVTAQISQGAFYAQLGTLPPGSWDLWAKACLGDECGATSITSYSSPCVTPVLLNQVVSRKTHGGSGTFDVLLVGHDPPPPGFIGIEDRSGGATGDFTLIFSFINPLTTVGGASVTSGVGSLANSTIDSSDAHNYIVNVTGVSNAQVITVSLADVRDSAGNFSPAVAAQMGVLLGDVNASKRVDAADVSSVRQQTLQAINGSNFRNDINASGRIDAADVSIARQQTLTSLP